MIVYAWKKAVAGIFFPRRFCVNCGKLSIDAALCDDCRRKLETLRRCPRCAGFVAPTETPDFRCDSCRGEETAFTQARAALPYEGHLRQKLLDFKYFRHPGLRHALAETLLLVYAHEYGDLRFDAVTCVPLHDERLQSRGYNHAELLSEIVAAELGFRHFPQALLRVKNTRPLAELSRREREAELSGAFRATERLSGMRMLLVDDIFTTGTSMKACSRALLNAGAVSVHGLTVAATEMKTGGGS